MTDPPQAKVLMVVGTSSSAGKSLLTAAICRCFARRGLRVAPFKAQNMSNNAAVCSGGGEIGRSQALQAIAAGVAPSLDMNPVLLKPEGQTRSQVVVNGQPTQTREATDYFQRREQLWPIVTSALDRLRANNDVVVIEGAGSPAELNLADVELVNMSVARYCQAPVLLVGDIERGGVFAQLLGTLWLLSPEDRALVRGLIVNKFRGDLSLFDSGVEILEQRGKVPVLGVLPWIGSLHLPEEDAVALDCLAQPNDPPTETDEGRRVDVAVIRLPHIANFDDFDPLETEPNVRLRYVRSCSELGEPDVVILPGTKNTFGDLKWLRDVGLADRVKQLSEKETHIIGICGGYQMLGRQINNPQGLEGGAHRVEGLGLLDAETTFGAAKQTRQVRFEVLDESVVQGMQGQTVVGYEIHRGQTATQSAWLKKTDAQEPSEAAVAVDGASAAGGRIWGCYLHGLFHNDPWRSALLRKLGISPAPTQALSSHDQLQHSLDRLANAFEAHVDFDRLMDIVFESHSPQEPQHDG